MMLTSPISDNLPHWLCMQTKLRSPTCIHDHAVQKAFEFSTTNRLDHKELVSLETLHFLLYTFSDLLTRSTTHRDINIRAFLFYWVDGAGNVWSSPRSRAKMQRVLWPLLSNSVESEGRKI